MPGVAVIEGLPALATTLVVDPEDDAVVGLIEVNVLLVGLLIVLGAVLLFPFVALVDTFGRTDPACMAAAVAALGGLPTC